MDGLDQDTALVRDLAEFAGMDLASVARKANVSPSTLQRPANGSATTRLSQRTLEKLQAAFPGYQGWARANETRLPWRAQESERDDLVDVAEIDLRFGLGSAFMDEEVIEHRAETRPFPRAWLRSITTSPADQLYWARGQGDSMEPKIAEGDIILIDRSQTSTAFGDLYWAIAYGHTAMVKRLRPMADGSVKILSDNPAVPPEIAYDGELHIFGRVVAVVKRI